jgi:hypothetical protein
MEQKKDIVKEDDQAKSVEWPCRELNVQDRSAKPGGDQDTQGSKPSQLDLPGNPSNQLFFNWRPGGHNRLFFHGVFSLENTAGIAS